MNTTEKKITQEFVIRVQITTADPDPKVLRALLDRVEDKLKDFVYTDSTGKVQVLLVHPN